MSECPFCDGKFGFSQELARHLATAHCGPDGPVRHTSGWTECVRCWCGEDEYSSSLGYRTALSQFAVHLQREGGAVAHWLAHALNLSR